MTTRILTGDARHVLAQLPAQSVGMVLTSPPYYGQRDYGHDDQIGLEDSPEAYIEQLVIVFREVHRVLRDDGVLLLNIADSYAGSWGAQGRSGGNGDGKHAYNRSIGEKTREACAGAFERKIARAPRNLQGPLPGAQPKDLIGIPWMLAFALRADGWRLRQDIVWNKPNAMPESVDDRCTKTHEYLFLLTKRGSYYWDAFAIREPASEAPASVARRGRAGGKPVGNSALFGEAHGQSGARALPAAGTGTRNARSVWTIATRASAVEHFATMAPALAERALKAGSSEHGRCPCCGARWVRVTRPALEVGHTGSTRSAYAAGGNANRLAKLRQAARDQGTEYTGDRVHVGWRPDCVCNFPAPPTPVPDVVLDPFGGAGTTALVADQLQRDAVLVELNPTYAGEAEARIRRDSSLLTEVITA